MGRVEVFEADLTRWEHQEAVVMLTDAYSRDPMGNGRPLAEDVRGALIPGLSQHPTTIVFIAYVDGRPGGIATCFRGFSTFAARPLLNIHDLAVLPEYRGQGVGRTLLDVVENKARLLGCCKVTLEVLERNPRARGVYEKAGFRPVAGAPDAGGVLFLSKLL
jgi:GNAT superfamily N-acetyltransferase